MRSNDEVAQILHDLYLENSRSPFLIEWADIRSIYGVTRLFIPRFQALAQAAINKHIYLFDLGLGANGHLVAVIKSDVITQLKRLPKDVVKPFHIKSDVEEPW